MMESETALFVNFCLHALHFASNPQMSSSVKELEQQLKEVGNSLLKPPPSVDELLNLLDRVENLLMNVEQAPNKSMQKALFPSMKALISDELLRHSNMDVKVFVLSCLSEITRITAPDSPYNDEQMKEIFQLTVAAFQHLSNVSSRCHAKAVSMLDTISKVRSCLMMLDLECDALVVEMFQHFLKVIGTINSEDVFSAMETIMRMVLDESEEISLDLLTPLLASVRKENKIASPLSWKLGEMVITKCADKLKPYLMEAVKVMGIAFDDYAPVVVSVCQDQSNEPKGVNVSVENLENENKLAKRTDLNDPPEASENKLAEKTISIDSLVTSENKLSEKNISIDQLEASENKLAEKTISIEPLEASENKVAEMTISIDSPTASENNSVEKTISIDPPKASENKLAEKIISVDPSETSESKLVKKTISIVSLEANENKLAEKTLLNELPQDTETQATDAPLHKETEKTVNGNCNATSNDSVLTKNDENGTNGNSSKTLKHCHREEPPKIVDPSGLSEPNNALSVETEKSKLEPDLVPRKRDWKPNSFLNPMEGYNHYWMSTGRKPALRRKSHDKGNDSSTSEDPISKKATSTSMTKLVTEPPVLEPKMNESFEVVTDSPSMKPRMDEAIADASPSQNHNLLEESNRKRGRPKKKGSTPKQEAYSKSPSISKGKCAHDNETTPPSLDMSAKKKTEETSTKKGKARENSRSHSRASRADVARERQQQTLTMQSTAKRATKRKIRETDSSSKDMSEGSGGKIISESAKGSSSKKAPRKRFKAVKEEESEAPELGDQLVGRRIKVWWPMDKMFYEGNVDSYDPIKEKHKISYIDGDEEILYLRKERWEVIGDSALTDEVQKTDLPRNDASSDTACIVVSCSNKTELMKKNKKYAGKKIISSTHRKRKGKSEKAEQAKADSSQSVRKRKGKRKTEQAKAASSEKIRRNRASNVKSVTADAKSANVSTLEAPKIKDEPVDEPIMIDEERKEDGKISPAKPETDELKTSCDSRQNAHGTLTSLKKDILEGGVESSRKKRAIKHAEQSRGAKTRKPSLAT